MIQNIRDLGGIRSMDGRTIRGGRLIRSAKLFRADKENLSGIQKVIDLRTSKELTEAPDRTFDLEYLHLPVFEKVIPGISHENSPAEQWIPEMELLYRGLIVECAESFSFILRAVMEHDYNRGAVLWHCTEGKDRCGLVTALILEALGVDRNIIMEDYLKTNLVNLPKAEKLRVRAAADRDDIFAENVYKAFIADEKYLNAAWDAMGEDYIQKVLNIPERTLRTFQDEILE